MILVVGATGMLGREICFRLIERGETVRALVRSTSAAAKTEALKAAGAELVIGDLKDPVSLAHACKGVDAVVSTASSTFSRQEGDSILSVDGVGQLSLVRAASAEGVLKFVFASFRHVEGVSFPLGDAKLEVENAIKGFNFTIIQASFFMEAWLTPALGFDYGNGAARIYGTGKGPISWVSVKDVAEMCVLAVNEPVAGRRVIEFGGPEALTPLEVIEKFQNVTGKAIKTEHIPDEMIRSQFDGAVDPLEKSLAALMLGYSAGDAIDMRSIQEEFGLKLTTVDEYAQTVAEGPADN